MTIPFRFSAPLLLFAAAALAGCGSAPPAQGAPIVQPGAPGQRSQVLSTEKAESLPQPRYTDADVKFMQGMIHHHTQAIEMTDLLATRTRSEDMKKLAERISISQKDEIKMMQHWLQAHGQEAPDPHAMAEMPGMDMNQPHLMMMPGMLTPEEMMHLASLEGNQFDKAFLTGMIKHHGGALTMVHELLATPGAAQDSDIFAFASDVEADQQMEIDRMTNMLKELK